MSQIQVRATACVVSEDAANVKGADRGFLALYGVLLLVYCVAGPLFSQQATWVSEVANTPIVYAIAPYALALGMTRRVWRGAVVGALTCLAMVVVFYLADDLSSGQPFNLTGFTTYAAQSVPAGAVFGLLGSVTAKRRHRQRVAVAMVFCVAWVGFQVADVAVPDRSTRLDDAALLANALVWSLLTIALTIALARRAPHQVMPRARRG